MEKTRRYLTIYISDEMRRRLDSAAAVSGTNRSDLVRKILERWSEAIDPADHKDILNRTIFLELATDALLKGHPDKSLRDLVHSTYRERLRRRQVREDVR